MDVRIEYRNLLNKLGQNFVESGTAVGKWNKQSCPWALFQFYVWRRFWKWGRDEGSCSIREGFGMNILLDDL